MEGCTPQLAESMAPELLYWKRGVETTGLQGIPVIPPFDNQVLRSNRTIPQYKWTNAIPQQVYVDKRKIQVFRMKKRVFPHKNLIKTNQKIKEMNMFSKFYYNVNKNFKRKYKYDEIN